MGAGAGEQWPEGAGLLVSTLRALRAGCTASRATPPPVSAPGEVKSPPRGPGGAAGLAEFPGSRRRRHDVLVSLLGTRRGFLGKEGESGSRHLASRGRPLLPGCPRPLRPVAGIFPEWNCRRGSSRAESLETGQSPALAGGSRWPPWASCLTADPGRTRIRG